MFSFGDRGSAAADDEAVRRQGEFHPDGPVRGGGAEKGVTGDAGSSSPLPRFGGEGGNLCPAGLNMTGVSIMRRRVVITGMGAITPLGNSVRDMYEAQLAGRSGVGPIAHFDA